MISQKKAFFGGLKISEGQVALGVAPLNSHDYK